jgi:hypothetical protein
VTGGEVSGVVVAFALAASAPFGWALCHWSQGRQRVAESFAAGASLAYVIVDLLVELTGIGAPHVHSTLPLGPSHEKSLFAVVLAGAAWWYIVAAVAAKMGGARARYRAHLLPQLAYGAFVGGAVALEAEHGIVQLALFAPPMLLHLTVVEGHIHKKFEGQHVGLPRAVLAGAPGAGAMAWAFLGFPESVLYLTLALVAGSTAVQVLQTELPTPTAVRIGPFLLGVGLYSAMVAARWAGG